MSIYIVSRVFSKEERPDPSDRRVFYGWSNSKHTIKAFIKQRDPKKYEYKKYDEEDFQVCCMPFRSSAGSAESNISSTSFGINPISFKASK